MLEEMWKIKIRSISSYKIHKKIAFLGQPAVLNHSAGQLPGDVMSCSFSLIQPSSSAISQ